MSKRKVDSPGGSGSTDDEANKQPRTFSIPETASYRSSLRTLNFVNAMSGPSHPLNRLEAVLALLRENSLRTESLMDMSLLVGDECAFSHLMQLFVETTGEFTSESPVTLELKRRAKVDVCVTLKQTLPRLLDTLDPAITVAATGNNILHDLLGRVVPGSPTDNWVYSVIEALVQHGVDIHSRNKQGFTVALVAAKTLNAKNHSSACSLRLLLQHGADINAQDQDGNTLMHHLIHNKVLRVIQNLIEEADVGALDLFVLDGAGHTLADLAAFKHAEEPHDRNAQQIHRLLCAQTQTWYSRIRPVVLSFLAEPLIPDLARLVLEYLDGSGRKFAAEFAS